MGFSGLTGLPSSLTDLLDTTVPPKPTGVTAFGIFTTVMVTWDNPQYLNYSFAEIWRANAVDGLGLLIPATGSNANGNSINFKNDAKLVGTSNGYLYSDPVEPNGRHYYWVRFISTGNVAGPYNSNTGLLGSTVQNIDDLMIANGWTVQAESIYQTGQWIGNAAILNGAIDNMKMADLAITTAKLNTSAVTNDKIMDAAINAVKIGAGAITSPKIADFAVTNAKIDNLAVDNAKIGNLAVDNSKIAFLAVDSTKIANAAITNAKIDNLAVDNAKIAMLAIDSTKIMDAAITNAKIDNLSVTNEKIANLAVDTAKITNAAITNAKMGMLSVGTAHIQDLAVTSAKIQSLGVEKLYATSAWIATASILDGAITNAKIGNTIQSDNYNGSNLGWQLSKSGGTLNVNQITIRDAAGNIILSSGTGLNWSSISGAPTSYPLSSADAASLSSANNTANTANSNANSAITTANNAATAAANPNWLTTVNKPNFGGFAYLSTIHKDNISTYIADLAVNTLQLAGNSISRSIFVSAGSLASTGSIAIFGRVHITAMFYASGSYGQCVHIYRDGVELSGVCGTLGFFSLTFVDQPSAGTYTYTASGSGAMNAVYMQILDIQK
jgi:hypothetical protein